MLKPFALIFILPLIHIFSSYGQHTDTGFAKQLKNIPQLTPSDSNCNFYKKNLWLPNAYIYNATCACLKTPHSLEANIIRYYLKFQLDSFPYSLKIIAQQQKEFLKSGKISIRKYKQFVKNNLTPIIYQ